MKKQISVASAIVLVMIGALVVFQITCGVLKEKYQTELDRISDGRQDFSKLFAVQEILNKNYVWSYDPQALGDSSLAGYLAGLPDGRSRYLDKTALADYTRLMNGQERGPGFDVSCDPDGNVVVSRVIEDTGAAQAGLLAGDRIVSVDSRSVSGLSPSGVTELIQKQGGDSVKVAFIRGGESLSADVPVSVFDYPSVTCSLSEGVAFVKIWVFDSNTANELSAAFDTFKNSGVTGVVFDLRSCDRGSFESACAVLDRLLSDVPYARTYSSSDDVSTLRASGGGILSVPAAVFTDCFTSGAAELVAASLRDCAGARVFGRTTAGNAAITTLFRLTDQSAVLITTRFFAPPVSGSFEGAGVVCDAETDDYQVSQSLLFG